MSLQINIVDNGFILSEESGCGLFTRTARSVFTDKEGLMSALSAKIDADVARNASGTCVAKDAPTSPDTETQVDPAATADPVL